MNEEKIKYSFAPSLIFLIACLYLNFFTLTIEQGINLQNDITITFFSTLKSGDLLTALITAMSLLFFKAILPLLPFFFMIGGGFLAIYFSLNKIDLDFFFLFQILASFIVLVFSNFSIFILFVLAGILIASIIFIRDFVEEESLFKSLRFVLSRNLFLTMLFLFAGMLVAMYSNLQTYEPIFNTTNSNLVKIFLNSSDIQLAQSSFVNQTAFGIKSAVNTNYNAISSSNQTIKDACGPAVDSIIGGINQYQSDLTVKINNQSSDYIYGNIAPAIQSIEKITTPLSPLLFALGALSVLEVIKPFVSILTATVISVLLPRTGNVEKLEKELHELNQKEEEVLKNYSEKKLSEHEFRKSVREIGKRRSYLESLLRRIKKIR